MPSAGVSAGWRRLPTLTGVTFTTTHLPAYLRAALASDPGRPRMTFYDDATGERVELSAQTLANWVTKTMNLLIDDLEVESGARVSLHLPRHWLGAVWIIAIDAVGAELLDDDRGDIDLHADLVVLGPEGLPHRHTVQELATVPEIFAVSLAPMAMPFGTVGNAARPPGTRDFCAEVRLMPDQVISLPDAPGRWADDGVARAEQLDLHEADRVAVTGEHLNAVAYLEQWIAPLAVDGSVVWTRNADAQNFVSRLMEEQVTVALGALPDGVTVPANVRHLSPPAPPQGPWAR